MRVVWRKPDSSVQYVAAGAGAVWALIGSAGSTEIVRFTLDGRLARVWKIPRAGRMAAEPSGCWVSASSWLLHINTNGRIHRVLQAPLDVTSASHASSEAPSCGRITSWG